MTTPDYRTDANVECPHCARHVKLIAQPLQAAVPGAAVQADFIGNSRVSPKQTPHPSVDFSKCPACNKTILQVTDAEAGKAKSWLAVPKTPSRRPVHCSVPDTILDDYKEALLVLADSPKSSAALARRCLQTLLVQQGAKGSQLVEQLNDRYSTLPSYVQTFVDSIRKLGNIAAHAKESRATAEIVDVEPGEAEWILELLEELFDHYYAKPAEAKAKQAALTAKFQDARKLTPKS